MNDNSLNLPFLIVTADGVQSLWAPERSGDYAADCAVGRNYGMKALEFIRASDNPAVLPRIIGAMPRGAAMGGVEIGFLTAVALAIH